MNKEKQKDIEKIEKLFALACSTHSEHERAAVMKKAVLLMRLHGLTYQDVTQERVNSQLRKVIDSAVSKINTTNTPITTIKPHNEATLYEWPSFYKDYVFWLIVALLTLSIFLMDF